jgi:CTP synthase (UTP-ammonia lyase)
MALIARLYKKMRIAIVGEYDPQLKPHLATESAIAHSSSLLGLRVDAQWIRTGDICERVLTDFHGVWIAPGSPYKNMKKTLWLIQYAREHEMPCLGTCGGFQHMLIEFARNMLGIQDAQHEEYDPYASRLIVSRLPCSLVGKRLPISLVEGSRARGFYGSASVIEEYYCNFGLNPEFIPAFSNSPFRIVGWDSDSQPRLMEMTQHHFFVGTLFVPQAKSTYLEPHPLVTAFIDAAFQAESRS